MEGVCLWKERVCLGREGSALGGRGSAWRGSAWRGSAWRRVGFAWRRGWIEDGLSRYGQLAVGTHQTGIRSYLSCIEFYAILYAQCKSRP